MISTLRNISVIRPTAEPVAKIPLRAQQWRIMLDALAPTHNDVKEFLRQKPPDPDLHGLTYGQLLLEYTTAEISRKVGELEITWHRQGKIPFAIPGIGEEAVCMAVERHLRQTDAKFGYYRQEAADLYRGGTSGEIFSQATQRETDTSGGARILAGHPGMDWRSNVHAISSVAAQALPGVGAALGIELRRQLSQENDPWRNFSAPDVISVIHVGDAAMAEGEAKESIDEMAIRNCPAVFVVHNNGGGISTHLVDGSVGSDPIAFIRGLSQKGLTVLEADATNLQQLFDQSKLAVTVAREIRTGVVLHVFNIYKRTHSSSDDPTRYTPIDVLETEEKLDPLPLMRQYLADHDVATFEELDRIAALVKNSVLKSGDKVVQSPQADKKEDLYRGVFAPTFPYHRKKLSEFLPDAIGETDLLESTRETGVEYVSQYLNVQPINMRQALTITLLQEMARDPRLIIFGEDVADFSGDTWKSLPHHLEQRINQMEKEISPEQIAQALDSLKLVSEGRGHKVDPEAFANLVGLVGGKGGVFKTTQFLQLAFGHKRVFNSRLAEASIVGTAVGYALSGFVPVVEIQFDSYWSPAYQQINDQLATLRWRSNGQFNAGIVIRIQGMNRLGGVGGIGHGEVITGKLNIPGIRMVMPAHASEAGPLLREAIRVARTHGEPVIFLEPIMSLNTSLGFYQGESAHIPIGEAEVRSQGNDFVVLTWSNNLDIVEEAQKTWLQMGIKPTVINMRTLGVSTDWKTVAPYIKKTSKVMIVESERSEGSAGANLSASIGEHFFSYLDAPITHIAARNFRTPAGTLNEAFALPQVPEIISKGISLAKS